MKDRLTFDHYRVCRRDDGSRWELGRGAMGVTFKALDVNLLRPVALKVIELDPERHEETRRALASEARSAARLRHRNIASVYHLGMDQRHVFYAMEFIEGETAEALVSRTGPLPPDVALRMVSQVARALVAAHRQGIVHRDIKPANLMISQEHPDDGPVVKVIDFGLAHPVEANAGRGFFGTPFYASPEQAEEAEVDARSDVYSLGCTLWFLLTGEPPLSGPLASVLTRKLRGDLPWERLRGQSQAVKQLLHIMLRRNPGDRPRDAQQLLAAIEGSLRSPSASHSLAAHLTRSSLAMKTWIAARPRRAALAGFSCLLLLTALAVPKRSASAGHLARTEVPIIETASVAVVESPVKTQQSRRANPPAPAVPVIQSDDWHEVEQLSPPPLATQQPATPGEREDSIVPDAPEEPAAEPLHEAGFSREPNEQAAETARPQQPIAPSDIAAPTPQDGAKRIASTHHSRSRGRAHWSSRSFLRRGIAAFLGRLF